MTPDDQIFHLRDALAKAERAASDAEGAAVHIFEQIWENKGLSSKIWEQIAEYLGAEDEEIPVSYDPAPITASDLLKLERRVARLERQMNPVAEPMAIPT